MIYIEKKDTCIKMLLTHCWLFKTHMLVVYGPNSLNFMMCELTIESELSTTISLSI